MIFTFKHGDRPLDGYTIQRGVGRGGFGEVYYAVSDSGKEVALKYLRDNPQVELRGVSHCLNLKSPHLVTVYDIRQNAAGEHFIIMEYVSGPSLRDLLVAEGEKGLGPQKAAFFLREIAKGLGYLHDRGIVHRDLKPGNIFYEDGYVKIGDYGLSKFISVSRHSAQTASVGTVHYMAPEVGTGNYHRGIDIYALGVVLYEMLLGRVPYEGSSMGEVLMKHLTAQPEVDQLPAPFAGVIRKALAKDPKERFQTVDEMVEAVYGEDDIRNSVARFEPTSLSMAAARAVPAHVAAGVGGSSGEVNLPPGGFGAQGLGGQTPPYGAGGAPPRADAGPDPAADRMGGRRPEDRWAQRSDWRRRPRDRMRARLDEANEILRSMERDRRGETPRFPPRSRWVAGTLGVIPPLGAFGIHRFYLGYTRIGILQIILTLVTGGTAGLWGFVEGLLILFGDWGRDVYGRPLVGGREGLRQPWRPVMQERWIGRLLQSVLIAAALSGGLVLVYGGPHAWESTFPTVLTFVLATAAAAMGGSVLSLRLRSPAVPPFLGRVVVFGAGLLMLLVASAVCQEAFSPPPYATYPSEVSEYYTDGQTGHRPAWGLAAEQRSMEARRRHRRMLETLVGALAVTMLLVDWPKRVQRGTEGRVDLGLAVTAGVVAAFASGIGWDDNYVPLAAGVAATASLLAQSASIFRLVRPGGGNSPGGEADGWRAGPPSSAGDPAGGRWTAEAARAERNVRDSVVDDIRRDLGGGRPTAPATPATPGWPTASAMQDANAQRPLRSSFERLGWGLVATALLATSIMGFVVLGSAHLSNEEAAMALGFGLVPLALQIFALSKLKRYPRYGTYRDTLRPLFIAGCVALACGGLSAMIAGNLRNDEVAIASGFIVVPLVFALFFLIVRGPQAPPSWSDTAGHEPHGAQTAPKRDAPLV